MRRATLWLVASTRPPLARPRLGKPSHREVELSRVRGAPTPAQSATKLTVVKQTQSPNSTGDARDWTPVLHRYREPNHVRSMLEVLITAVPFVLLWILMWASLG